MKVNIFIISSLVGVLVMIKHSQSVPIEVVYTGDSCDCPRNLNYMVNVPPPPTTNEYQTSEYGYKLDVPVQRKAKVTYSFDFTVQEPKIPPPTEQEKWNLYAKVDRITAQKKDCYATDSSSSSCACNHCTASRSNGHRYVSPEAHVMRQFNSHPNSISKSGDKSTSKLLAIFVQPLGKTQNIPKKFRNKRDISRFFSRGGFQNNQVKRQGLVKQYTKRLLSRGEIPNFFSKAPLPPKPKPAPKPARPFEKLRNFLVPPRLRNKRDIKGEYDLLEKEREQLDLTLPEIIQYMPETLNPNFKRGQCQFSHLCELQEPQLEMPAMDAKTPLKDKAEEETLQNIEDKSTDSTGESGNAISSTLQKRNADDYNCNSNGNSYNPQFSMPTPNPGYIYAYHTPPTVNPNYDARPRPFTVTATYGIDPAPQQYVGAPQQPITNNAPMVGAAYYPHDHHPHHSNAQLDQIIADIVNRHSDFIEASSHPGGSLVDPTKEQEYQTKSLLKNLWDGHWKKWFADEPLDNSYSYMPNYQAPAPGPVYAPRSH